MLPLHQPRIHYLGFFFEVDLGDLFGYLAWEDKVDSESKNGG